MQVFHAGGAITDVATVLVRYHNVVVTVTLDGLEHSNRGSYGPVSHVRAVGGRPGVRPRRRGFPALNPPTRPWRLAVGSATPRATRLVGVLVVGFDTATPAVSVAIHDGKRVVGEAFAVDARRHGELLMPMIAQVMAEAGASRADLTAVAVGVGPGPYTGLRVGVVTARVLGAVLGIPVHGVCTLDVIAAAAGGEEFCVATDARRKEVYWARYDANRRRLEGPWSAPPAIRGRRGSRWPGPVGSFTRRRSAR